MSEENIINRVTIRGQTFYLRDSTVIDGVPTSLPAVTDDDNGSILRVVNGGWQIVPVATAEEGDF